MAWPEDNTNFRSKENIPGLPYDETDKTTLFVEDIQQIEQCIATFENILGLNPQGEATDVAERLSDIEAAIGGGTPGGGGLDLGLAVAINNGIVTQ